ncbi:transposase [Gammaproteobacteria bacterium]|nr:transposase [Gammaproteobacteria bacterium]
MPRRARMYLPDFPYHLIQRGNNREAVFYESESYQYYLSLWQQLSVKYGVDVHAYVLMTNHIHFLATPRETDSLSLVMKNVGSRYAQYVNKRYTRTGSLWEGRHKSSLVSSARYLLTCYRYIELNPVRACMVAQPEEYQWSSYGANAWGDTTWLTAHDEYLRLGKNTQERLNNYRNLFNEQLSESAITDIRLATQYCQPLGDDLFKRQIEKKLGRRLGYTKRGRPFKDELRMVD